MGKLVTGLTDTLGLTDTAGAKETAEKGRKVSQDQLDRIMALDIPDIEKQKLVLENPELVGLLNAETIDPSQMGEISLDPALREKQMAALSDLEGRANEDLTAQDKYSMEQLLGGVNANERAQRSSVESEMARRGMDSSGAALLAKLQGGQNTANSARDKAMQMAAQGQQNRLQALQALGKQSAGMEQADFNRQSQVASAKDTIARANAMNRQNVNAQNLDARQNIENQRVNISNREQISNKNLYQSQFDNKIKKENAASGTATTVANSYANEAAAKAKADAATTGLITKAGMAYATGAADGGIIEKATMPTQYQSEDANEMYRAKAHKQHETFKHKYMKRVQEEVMGTYPHKSKLPEAPKGISGESSEIKYGNGGTYMSDGGGDIVDSGEESYAGDRVDAKINDGELVLNVAQQQRLMDLLRGKINVDDLGTDDIVEGVPREYREDMEDRFDQEEQESEGEASPEMMGMMAEPENDEDDSQGETESITKLLQMLGK